jgi:lipopolysaccharide export system protein LptA
LQLLKKPNRKFKYFFFILLALLPIRSVFAQRKTRIRILHADHYHYNARINKDIQQLIGHVKLKQDSTLFFCDSAYLNDKLHNLDAYGQVHINVNDTLNIYGDRLHYNGKTRIGELFGNVKLQDPKAVLTTEHLVYNRITGIAFYDVGGTIVSDSNVLTSQRGDYDTRTKIFYFKKDVVLTNPDQVTHADTLIYNTINKTAYFKGPTLIKGNHSVVKCLDGWYNTATDMVQMRRRPEIESGEQQLSADSIRYNNHTGFGRAFGNICVLDTLHSLLVKGRKAEIWNNSGITYVTDSAVSITYDEQDSMFLHADTLWVYFDRKHNAKKMLSYHSVRFFRSDLQGKCDSLAYAVSDSVIRLYHTPVLWTGKNQLTADSIFIAIHHNQLDSLTMFNTAFIISSDSSGNFNQIKGRDMVGYFRNNEIYKVKVDGNAQSVYWVRDEKNRLIGVNKAEASYMIIRVKNNEIKAINYIEQATETMYPAKELPPEERILKGFVWYDKLRPRSKYDIFRKNTAPSLP